MRTTLRIAIAALLLAAWPGTAAAQLDTLTNAGACPVTAFAAGATTVTVATGCGATLPSANFNVAVCNVTDFPSNCKDASGALDSQYEVIRVTSRSTDTLTVTRAQEGTSDANHNTGSKTYWAFLLTAKTFTDINTALGATYLTTSANSILTNENSGLTAGRVPYMASGPVVADDSELLWDATDNILKLSSSWTWPNEAFALQIERTVTTPPTAQSGCCGGVQAMALLYGRFAQGGSVGQQRVGQVIDVGDDSSVRNQTVSGAASDGGEIELTATAHGFSNGDRISVYGVGGTTEANGVWTIEDVTTDTFRLDGSTFSNAYTSGGTATNRGVYYGLSVNVGPTIDRTGSTLTGTATNGDDVAGITINNAGQTSMATDGLWITDAGSTGRRAWHSIIASDSGANQFLAYSGKVYSAGIDVSGATLNAGTEPMFKLGAGHNFEFDTGTGTKIGTSSSQKIGLWGATPVVRPSSTTDLRQALIDIGAYTTGGASPLDLNGGALTAAAITGTGDLAVDTSTLFVDSTNNEVGIGLTGGMLGPFHVSTDTVDNVVTMDRYNSTTTPVLFVSRAARGSKAAPRRTLSGDVIFSWLIQGGGAADNSTDSTFNVNSVGLRAVALEDFTNSANGARLDLRTVAVGSTTTTTRAIVNTTGITVGTTTAARSGTDGTNLWRCFDGTAPSGTLTNGADLGCESGELVGTDSGGNKSNLTASFTSSVQGVVPASGSTSTTKFLTANATFVSPEQSKTISIESPSASENFSGIRFNQAVTVTKVVAVLQGSSTPSVTWQVRHGTDRSAAGTDLFTANKTTTSVTTGAEETTTFNDATLAANEFLWIATTAQSGTVTAIHLTIFYTVD